MKERRRMRKMSWEDGKRFPGPAYSHERGG